MVGRASASSSGGRFEIGASYSALVSGKKTEELTAGDAGDAGGRGGLLRDTLSPAPDI